MAAKEQNPNKFMIVSSLATFEVCISLLINVIS